MSETAAPPPSAGRTALRTQASMRFTHLHPPFHRFMAGLPEACLATPSMMSESEREFLYNLARRYYRGVGRIVDAGIFLGGSTTCFAAGLRESAHLDAACERWPRPVLSLERAVTSATMPAFFGRHGVGGHYRPGDSFADLLATYVQPNTDLVELRVGDITEVGGIEDRIEILFLDVLKMPAIANYAIAEYFPRLIPGRALVIQQDYFFEGLSFIKTAQEYFGDHFEYVGEIGSSAVFRLIHKIAPAHVRRFLAGVAPEDQLHYASVAMQRSIDPTRRLMMAFSKARLINDLHGQVRARAYLAGVEDDFSGELRGALPPRLATALRETREVCGAGNEQEVEAA